MHDHKDNQCTMSSCVHMMSAGVWHQFLFKNAFLRAENENFRRAARGSSFAWQRPKKFQFLLCQHFLSAPEAGATRPQNQLLPPFLLEQGVCAHPWQETVDLSLQLTGYSCSV